MQAVKKTIRERQAELMAQRRSGERNIILPKCKNPRRRSRCEKNIPLALQTYFPQLFYNPFSPQQLEMIAAIEKCARYGGRQAIAGPRGFFGKTTITTCTTILLVLYGVVKFPLVVQATGPAAKRTLRNIKTQLRFNPLLLQDFPEVCVLARYVGSAPARANGVTVGKERHEVNMVWRDDFIILPTIEKSKSSGGILCTTGIGGEIRGLLVEGNRPDMVIGDDLETRESAASLIQTQQIEQTIEQDIAGLSGPGKTMACILLCTCINRNCVAYQYTDRKIKPSWHGVRYKMLTSLPENKDWWEKYISDRISGMESGDDPDGRKPHERYVAERHIADAGGLTSNPYAFIAGPLADGSQTESSAIQHCYNRIADGYKAGKDGWVHFLTEYQNDPPDEEHDDNQITSSMVARRISGMEHRQLPPECEKIVSFIDLGEQACHWVDVGWAGRCVGSVLDYGTLDVRSGEFNPITKMRDPKTLEIAIMQALHEWRGSLLSKYRDANGQPRELDLALIDSGSGLHTKTVYRFCREVGRPFHPSKGREFGFRIPKDNARHGDFWALVRQLDGTLLFEFDATEWKKFLHQRFITETFDANAVRRDVSLGLFICPDSPQLKKDRLEFTHQIVAKTWGSKRPGAKPTWIIRGAGKDHYEDATAGCCLGANIVGIKMEQDPQKRRPMLSLAEMAEAAKRKVG